MPARSTSFQRLVTAIHACSVGIRKVSESAMLSDMDTGESREVDVLISSKEAEYEFLISVEVVEWSRKADVPWVEKMIQKHERLPTNKLVLISKSGFTKHALRKARAHGVEPLELEPALNVNWDLATKLIGGGGFQLLDINWKCTILPTGSEEWITPKNSDLIQLPDQESPLKIGAFAQHLVNLPLTGKTIFDHLEKNSEEDFHIVFTQNGSEYVDGNGSRIEIDQLCINMKANLANNPFEFSTRSLKGNSFGVGEAIDTESKFCFAIKEGPDGRTTGVVYDNGNIRNLQSYS